MFAYRLMGTRKTITEGVDWREEPGVTWENEIIPQAQRHSPSYLTNWECSKMQSSPWGKSIFKVVALDLFHAYFQCCYGWLLTYQGARHAAAQQQPAPGRHPGSWAPWAGRGGDVAGSTVVMPSSVAVAAPAPTSTALVPAGAGAAFPKPQPGVGSIDFTKTGQYHVHYHGWLLCIYL